MTVPEHEPRPIPEVSLMLSFTTDVPAVEHSVPLTIRGETAPDAVEDVPAIAAHASTPGVVGVDGDVGAVEGDPELPPPQAAARETSSVMATVRWKSMVAYLSISST
jgi:hypothetical protein